MDEILLGSTRRLVGVHAVNTTLRPVRLAYLVDAADAGSALAAVDSSCQIWGETSQILIPCTPDDCPDAFWNLIMERHDPGVFIDVVGAEPAFLEEQEHRHQRRVSRWANPTETMEWHGVLLTSVLQGQIDRAQWERNYSILNLHPLFGHLMALPLAYRLGHRVDRHSSKSALLPPDFGELATLAQRSRAAQPEPIPTAPTAQMRSLRRRLSPQMIEELVARYNAGEDTPTLSREHGISKTGLRQLFLAEGVAFRRQGITPEVADTAVRLYETGLRSPVFGSSQ
jgi:hypothetical protein